MIRLNERLLLITLLGVGWLLVMGVDKCETDIDIDIDVSVETATERKLNTSSTVTDGFTGVPCGTSTSRGYLASLIPSAWTDISMTVLDSTGTDTVRINGQAVLWESDATTVTAASALYVATFGFAPPPEFQWVGYRTTVAYDTADVATALPGVTEGLVGSHLIDIGLGPDPSTTPQQVCYYAATDCSFEALLPPGGTPGKIIPTLSEWGLLVLTLLMVGFGAWVIVTRKRSVPI